MGRLRVVTSIPRETANIGKSFGLVKGEKGGRFLLEKEEDGNTSDRGGRSAGYVRLLYQVLLLGGGFLWSEGTRELKKKKGSKKKKNGVFRALERGLNSRATVLHFHKSS